MGRNTVDLTCAETVGAAVGQVGKVRAETVGPSWWGLEFRPTAPSSAPSLSLWFCKDLIFSTLHCESQLNGGSVSRELVARLTENSSVCRGFGGRSEVSNRRGWFARRWDAPCRRPRGGIFRMLRKKRSVFLEACRGLRGRRGHLGLGPRAWHEARKSCAERGGQDPHFMPEADVAFVM